jgi:tetratricopeptide (TPR) repeat protein
MRIFRFDITNPIARAAMVWACLTVPFLGLAGQDQDFVDSLEIIYREGNFDPEQELEILRSLASYHTNADSMLRYAGKLIEQAEAAGESDLLSVGYLQTGYGHRLKGDLEKALENYFRVAILATGSGSLKDRATARVAIADVYSVKGDHERAVNNYREGIRIFRKINDSVRLASAVLNLGDEFFNAGELDSALQQFDQSGLLFQDLDYDMGVA